MNTESIVGEKKYSLKEAAAIAGITVGLLRSRINSGDLKALRYGPRKKVVIAKDLLEYMNKSYSG